MRILVLEDDQSKCEDVVAEVGALFPGALISTHLSYQSGLRELVKGGFDLVVLDMSMPTFDKTPKEPTGGRFRPFAGRDILQQIRHRRLKTRAAVVTAFDVIGEGAERITLSELDSQLADRFGAIYLGAVYYSRSRGEWKGRLDQILKPLARPSSKK